MRTTKHPFPALLARSVAAMLVPMMLTIGCAGVSPPQRSDALVPVGDCAAPPLDAAGRPAIQQVRWLVHSEAADRPDLDEWCRGVGAPVIALANAAAVQVDSVAVITWNIHVGAGRIDSLVADLHSGALTGSPASHFVLLLQEARREGAGVPAVLPRDGRGTRRLGPRDAGEEADIVATARRLGLRLFYVPSMRNGGREHAAEDRGNAILSSLPLTELTAIELPLLSQRRVAVAATIPLIDAGGQPRELRVSSVHLDYGASRERPLAPFGAGRTLQAGALAAALAEEENIVVGGDFNTWSLERLEGGLSLMQTRFPDFPRGSTEATFYTGGIWPRRLDHLFLRAADVAGSAPDRIDYRYGSDHHPLIAWIRFAATAPVAATAAQDP